jgi:hypothetical protein
VEIGAGGDACNLRGRSLPDQIQELALILANRLEIEAIVREMAAQKNVTGDDQEGDSHVLL